jgi:lipoprotein-anchoring transpeptidase ErfK/SrfK
MMPKIFAAATAALSLRRQAPSLLMRNALSVSAAVAILMAFGLVRAPAAVLIQINKSAQQMTVSVDGEQRYVWPVSTGRSGYDTPSGNFNTFRMEANHFSKEWDNAPMPHAIFFTMKGHAIHGTYETKYLGGAASHGCVRLPGAILSVPVLAISKIICDRVRPLAAFGHFLER